MTDNEQILNQTLLTLPSGKVIQRKYFSQYSIDELSNIISECDNISHIIRVMKINSVYHNKIKKIIEDNKISIKHFKIKYIKTPSNDSEIRSKSTFKRKLLNEGKLINKCAICNMDPFWNNIPITLQLDHINGVNTDNRIENLRLLCPNCHSQTYTYTGRNINKLNKTSNIVVVHNKIIIPKKDKFISCLTCNISLCRNNSTGYCVKCYKLSDKYKDTFKNKEKKQYNCKNCNKSVRQNTSTGCCVNCYSDYKKTHNIISREKTLNCTECKAIVNTYNKSKLCKICYFKNKKNNMKTKEKSCNGCGTNINYANKSNLCLNCYNKNKYSQYNTSNTNEIIIPTVELQNANEITINKPDLEIKPTINPIKYTCKDCNIEITNKGKKGICQPCYKKTLRIVERPSYGVLLNEIHEHGYVQTGKKYGVSDNSIRKWIKNYTKNVKDKPLSNNQKVN
jgi:Zn finger protein HypA/HybF involved in hydrogenase expression